MLYLFQVCALVAAAVFVPLLLLYLVVAVARIGLLAVLSAIRGLKNVSAVPTHFSREHWNPIHR